METEGVIQYRLLGSHPAASGRYHSFGFSGDTVLVEIFLQEVVKQHQINLTKYKLEIRRLPSVNAEREDNKTASSGGENDILNLNSLLCTYDRIVVNISRRHYLDMAVEVGKEEENIHEDRLQHVENLLMKDEEPSNTREASFRPEKRGRSSDESHDPQAFIRVTALSNKAFPLIPCLQRQRSANLLPLPKPIKGTCVLCELDCFGEVVLPCCHFSVCGRCLELAKVMLVGAEECVVCGVVPGEQTTSNVSGSNGRVFVKREGHCAGTTDITDRGRQGNQRGILNFGVSNLSSVQSRIVPMVAAFEADLTGNMPMVLSLLDVTDPLTMAAKEKRRVSAILAQFSNE